MEPSFNTKISSFAWTPPHLSQLLMTIPLSPNGGKPFPCKNSFDNPPHSTTPQWWFFWGIVDSPLSHSAIPPFLTLTNKLDFP